MAVTLSGTEKDWPQVRQLLFEFGTSRNLEVFQFDSNIPDYIRTLRVYICSSDGLKMAEDLVSIFCRRRFKSVDALFLMFD